MGRVGKTSTGDTAGCLNQTRLVCRMCRSALGSLSQRASRRESGYAQLHTQSARPRARSSGISNRTHTHTRGAGEGHRTPILQLHCHHPHAHPHPHPPKQTNAPAGAAASTLAAAAANSRADGSARYPPCPWGTDSVGPPLAHATTGRAAAIASMGTMPKCSFWLFRGLWCYCVGGVFWGWWGENSPSEALRGALRLFVSLGAK